MHQNCDDCFNKDMRIKSLELWNRSLKQKVYELENIGLFSWVSWFLFGECTVERLSVDEFGVGAYESDQIKCRSCNTTFEYDNGNPENAEAE